MIKTERKQIKWSQTECCPPPASSLALIPSYMEDNVYTHTHARTHTCLHVHAHTHTHTHTPLCLAIHLSFSGMVVCCYADQKLDV